MIAPATREIHSAARLLIIADGPLDRLPFGALTDSAGRYLVESVSLEHGRGLRAGERQFAAARRIVIVSSPTFNGELFPELESLRGAAREGRAVRAAHRSGLLLEGDSATKQHVLSALSHATVFHFAGHARTVDGLADRSHLVLARSPGGLATNALAGSEIAHLNLHTLDLVVLSACGTTQSRSRRDPVARSLADDFFRAGAGTVISSLWEADDDATVDLMSALHERLEAGASATDALHDAQLAMIAAGRRNHAPPAWSAFRLERGAAER